MSWPVFTLHDLQNGLPGVNPPASLAVFGDPVAHSRSPQMHNPALAARGLPGQYIRLHIRPDEFSLALETCGRLGFVGVNCTIPHKFSALQAVQNVDPVARRLGAVNTVAFRPDGTYGYNSDGPGLLRALDEEFGPGSFAGRICVLGAGGGAGRGAAIQVGLAGCEERILVNRTREKAEAVRGEIVDAGFPPQRISTADTPPPDGFDLLINATSAGMKPDDPLLVAPDVLRKGMNVYDMIYSPPETPLLRLARAAGARTANGLSMLLHQGAVSFEHWFGPPAPLEAMRHGLLDTLKA